MGFKEALSSIGLSDLSFSDSKLGMSSLFSNSEPVQYFWKDLTLTDPKEALDKVDLSKAYSLEKALAYFSKNLNFIEKLEVLKTVCKSNEVDFEAYFKSLNIHFDSNLHKKIMNKLDLWPKEFVLWAKSKDLNPKDFRVFLNEKEDALCELLTLVGELKPSKSNGLKIIDLSLDLLAQNKVSFEKLKEFMSDQKLLNFLNKIRFSNTIESDEELGSRFLKLDLSGDAKISVQRNGDQNQIKVELRALNPEDLLKKMTKVQKKINEIKNAWTGEGE